MSTAFLVVSIVAFLLTANALRPLPVPLLAVPSFFSGWITSEYAPHHLVAYVLIAGGLVAGGAVEGWQGWVALGLSVVTVGGLVSLIVEAQRARHVMERALCQGLGDDYLSRISPDFTAHHDLRVPWRQVVLPLMRRHPDVKRRRNLQYWGEHRRGRLDVYRRRDEPTGCPVLLQIHGGAWVIGNKDQQGIPLMLHLAARGWVCVSTNYRLSPKASFPDHLVDLKRALAWVKEHIAEYGGNNDFVVVSGGSAGGHLSALMALTANDPEYQPGFEDVDTSVQAAVPYYGVYDFTNECGQRMSGDRIRFLERVVMKKRMRDDRAAFERASPANRVHAGAPPFFVIHGAHDSLVPVAEARWFVDRLRAVAQAPVVYAELPGAQHAFEVLPSIRTAHVTRAVERFLDYVYSEYLEAAATSR